MPSHQELVENQVKTKKKPSSWSRFGKIRVETKETQKIDHLGNTTKKRKKNASVPKKISPYGLYDQELKTEEGNRAKRKYLNRKTRQQRKLEKNAEVLDASEFLRKKVPKESRNKKEATQYTETNH